MFFRQLNKDDVWQRLQKVKYFVARSLTQTQVILGDSYFCYGLMKMKSSNGVTFQVKVGNKFESILR